MKKLNKRQQNLLSQLHEHGPCNTHQLAVARGDQQAYESHLRDRLLRLYERGAIWYEEVWVGTRVVERIWGVEEY